MVTQHTKILTFSRQSKPEVQPVQVGLLAKEALKLLRASLPATIEIQLDIQSQGYVTADPTQLHQVIMNLCTNAGQAMQSKGGVLQLKLCDRDLTAEEIADHPDLHPGSYLEMLVRVGRGISPLHRDSRRDGWQDHAEAYHHIVVLPRAAVVTSLARPLVLPPAPHSLQLLRWQAEWLLGESAAVAFLVVAKWLQEGPVPE